MSTTTPDQPLVGVVMGSDSDWPVMEAAALALEDFGIPYEADVVSAHRMPTEMIAYGQEAADRGLRVIIAGGRRVCSAAPLSFISAYSGLKRGLPDTNASSSSPSRISM